MKRRMTIADTRPYKKVNSERDEPHNELKFAQSLIIDAVVATAGAIFQTIFQVPQGSGQSQRNGRRITVTSIHWRFRISLPPQDGIGSPKSGDTLRVIMYLDKQANGGAALVTDILDTAAINSFRQMSNIERFEILSDDLYNFNYSGMASDAIGNVSQGEVVKSYVTTKHTLIPVEYSGTDGLLTEIRSNNVGILLISSKDIMGFGSVIRIRYTDN